MKLNIGRFLFVSFMLLFLDLAAKAADKGFAYVPSSGEFEVVFPTEFSEIASYQLDHTLTTAGAVDASAIYLARFGLNQQGLPKEYRKQFLEEVKKSVSANLPAGKEQKDVTDEFESLKFSLEHKADSEYQTQKFRIIVADKYWVVLSVSQYPETKLNEERAKAFLDSFNPVATSPTP